MTVTTAHPLTGWDVCNHPGCPLTDPAAPEPDNIGDLLDTGIAHGVQHLDISDQWWTCNTPTGRLGDHNPTVLAAAAWLAYRDGRQYCVRSTKHAGEWAGYQLEAAELLAAVDQEVTR